MRTNVMIQCNILGKYSRLTQRAADKWDSARFLAFFLVLSFPRFPAESQPSHLSANASRWAAEIHAESPLAGHGVSLQLAMHSTRRTVYNQIQNVVLRRVECSWRNMSFFRPPLK